MMIISMVMSGNEIVQLLRLMRNIRNYKYLDLLAYPKNTGIKNNIFFSTGVVCKIMGVLQSKYHINFIIRPIKIDMTVASKMFVLCFQIYEFYLPSKRTLKLSLV